MHPFNAHIEKIKSQLPLQDKLSDDDIMEMFMEIATRLDYQSAKIRALTDEIHKLKNTKQVD